MLIICGHCLSMLKKVLLLTDRINMSSRKSRRNVKSSGKSRRSRRIRRKMSRRKIRRKMSRRRSRPTCGLSKCGNISPICSHCTPPTLSTMFPIASIAIVWSHCQHSFPAHIIAKCASCNYTSCSIQCNWIFGIAHFLCTAR